MVANIEWLLQVMAVTIGQKITENSTTADMRSDKNKHF